MKSPQNEFQPAPNVPATIEEALELADRYPNAECWREYRRNVLGTPRALPPAFQCRLAATVAADPVAFGRLVMHAVEAVQQQEGEPNG